MNEQIFVSLISAAASMGCAAIAGFTSWNSSRKTKKALIDSNQDERLDKLENGMLCILRDQIIGASEKYISLGYCPMYIRENLAHAYQTYHALGGNGAVTSLYEQAMELPAPAKIIKKGMDKNEN